MAKRRRRKTNPGQDTAFVGLIVVLVLGLGFKSVMTQSLVQTVLLVIILVGVLGVAAVFWYNLRQSRLRRDRAQAVTGELIDHMTGEDFEQYVGEILRWQGYRIIFTPQSGDFGVDIVASKGRDKCAVQIKRYKRRLDGAAIREAIAGKAVYGCSKAMVVTNSYFTKAAVELALRNECELVDRDKLADWVLDFQRDLKKGRM